MWNNNNTKSIILKQVVHVNAQQNILVAHQWYETKSRLAYNSYWTWYRHHKNAATYAKTVTNVWEKLNSLQTNFNTHVISVIIAYTAGAT